MGEPPIAGSLGPVLSSLSPRLSPLATVKCPLCGGCHCLGLDPEQAAEIAVHALALVAGPAVESPDLE